jgi:hypothetical protein
MISVVTGIRIVVATIPLVTPVISTLRFLEHHMGCVTLRHFSLRWESNDLLALPYDSCHRPRQH